MLKNSLVEKISPWTEWTQHFNVASCGKEYRDLRHLINFINFLLHTKMFVGTSTFKMYRLKKLQAVFVRLGYVLTLAC